LEFCKHNDDDIRRRAFAALEKNSDPTIRQFALDELQKGNNDASVISLFIKSYQKGDEQCILQLIEPSEDKDDRHWQLMELRKVLENNTNADSSQLAVLAYALTPCASCRFSAASLLHARNMAPSWLTEECQFDSESDTRELVGTGHLGQTITGSPK
jgi:hypothetical protein